MKIQPPLPPPAEDCVRVVLVGDVVGKPGMRIACMSVPFLRQQLHIDTIVVNAENAADGSGIRCKDYRKLIEHGVDAITLGDHLYRKREIIEILVKESNIVRPANLPFDAPGKEFAIINSRSGVKLAICSLLGRVFMKPVDCPFRAADRILLAIDPTVRIRLFDFHAEATSDMQLLGRHLDGRVTAVLGTHTHVSTADEQILPGGTGFQCDVGMTGPFNGILGRKTEAVLEATLTSLPIPFQVATGDVRLNGTWFDANIHTGRCEGIGRLVVMEDEVVAFEQQCQTVKRVL